MKNHFNKFIKVLQLDKGGEYNFNFTSDIWNEQCVT
jgi:hypothetical protein